MLTKYAKLDVLEVRSAPVKQTGATLTKFASLGDYIDSDGFLYVRVRAISSRVNKNGDGWPSEELRKAYKSFVGKPIFVDHHNSDPKRARGVIVDAAYHLEDHKTASLDPYWSKAPDPSHMPPCWIELLLEVDAKRFPRLAKSVISGDIDGVSMGANVAESVCSHCGNIAEEPSQFCRHIQSKNAYFDFIDPDTGHKTSKKAYENCKKVSFFEISFVFDPADETALIQGMDKKKLARVIQEEGILKKADNPPPQHDMTRAPGQVNTLRQDQTCEVCGSDLDEGTCQVCGFSQPPEGFNNPNLEKAKELDEQRQNQQGQEAAQEYGQGGQEVAPDPGQGGGFGSSGPTNGQATSATNNEKTSAIQGGRINTQERPILPVTRKLTDKPIGKKTVQDAMKPTTSKTRKETMPNKLADGAKPEDGQVQAENRVEVEGVGGVSGDPLNGIKHENVEKAMEQKGGPATKTWTGDEGDNLGQHEPVSGTPSDQDLGGPIGTGVSASTHIADAEVTVEWPSGDAGFPDHQPSHVDLDSPLKEEVGAGTQTDPSEEFRSLKHADPVDTSENGNDVGGPIGEPAPTADITQHNPEHASSYRHAVAAMRLAETEVELGLIGSDQKWNRLAELENVKPDVIQGQLDTLARVRTAGLHKNTPVKKIAGRIPSLAPVTNIAGFDITASNTVEIDTGDILGW